MDVRRGYQQSEAGIIPGDWDQVSIGDVAEIKGGKRLPAGYSLVDRPTPHPYVRVSDLVPGGVRTSEIKYVPVAAFPFIQNYRIFTADIFISVAGTLGIVGVVPSELDGANLTENADRITNIACDRDYLKYWLLSHPVQREIEAIRTVGAQPKLAIQRIAKFRVALPKRRPEQRAIATALGDADALLDGLDQLIAKKRDLKQAAMQQLLTGRTRLPGYSGEWNVKRFGDLGEFLKGAGVTKGEAHSGVLPCVRYGEIYTHHNDYVRQFSSSISPTVAGCATRLVQGDLLFACSGETKQEIGKCVAFIQDCEAYAGGDIIILRPERTDPLFLGFLCNTAPVARQKASRGQGDAVVHISVGALSGIQVKLPPLEEQTAIASVLFDMDAELAALEARRVKTRDLKQAMVQELLTGRTRLAEPDTGKTPDCAAGRADLCRRWPRL